jgi:hypothetical protein
LKKFVRLCSLVLVPATLLCHRQAVAEPIVAGVTNLPIAAIQDVELLPGSPFNPTGSSIFITDLTAVGSFSIIQSAQVGSSIDFTSGMERRDDVVPSREVSKP